MDMEEGGAAPSKLDLRVDVSRCAVLGEGKQLHHCISEWRRRSSFFSGRQTLRENGAARPHPR